MAHKLNVSGKVLAAVVAAFDSGMSLMEALGGKRVASVKDQLVIAHHLAKHVTTQAKRNEKGNPQIVAYKSKAGNVTFGVILDVAAKDADGKSIITRDNDKPMSYKKSPAANKARMWFTRNIPEAPEADELTPLMKSIMADARAIASLGRNLKGETRREFRQAVESLIAKYKAKVPSKATGSNVTPIRKAA